ncbi:MAG: hypothetical protein ACI3VB_08375 [Oscillospiraceae bacterium]
MAVWLLCCTPKLVGGELYTGDFKDGFTIYFEEAHDGGNSSQDGLYEELHVVWRAVDQSTADDVYQLCRSIQSYRKYDSGIDLLIGGATADFTFHHLPTIYISAGDAGYRIELINRQELEQEGWPYQIFTEIDGPVIRFYRIDMTLKPEDVSELEFLMTAYDMFIDDGAEISEGWYSTMTQDSYDELLNMLPIIQPGDDSLSLWHMAGIVADGVLQ